MRRRALLAAEEVEAVQVVQAQQQARQIRPAAGARRCRQRFGNRLSVPPASGPLKTKTGAERIIRSLLLAVEIDSGSSHGEERSYRSAVRQKYVPAQRHLANHAAEDDLDILILAQLHGRRRECRRTGGGRGVGDRREDQGIHGTTGEFADRVGGSAVDAPEAGGAGPREDRDRASRQHGDLADGVDGHLKAPRPTMSMRQSPYKSVSSEPFAFLDEAQVEALLGVN